jgi:hypothetical protein
LKADIFTVNFRYEHHARDKKIGAYIG